MQVKGFGAGYLVDDVAATTRFYADVIGLPVTVELDWFASVNAGAPGYEISFVRRGHDSVPEGYRAAETTGLMFGLVVEDATGEAKRLAEAGVELVTPVVDEPWGQRHFYVADPNGVLLDVIEMIPADPEWVAANTPAP
ncbi:Glyoxalase/Bleomycin resistance protein/Dioxygenase superfamily protein [Amycolatopsis pretoriensis]|uniref:Glyoxalase/Bleomycin resistance protein/Dioxygenase superfamily protein n=1 Tax=Amycolatopsis pretoriensis TaxID=218821 RepID=A0A1H5R3A1_9PSEU|nr:VOC family protein [Amycolatopsis pretoriensis]SEF32876.1 Glyoxalase/Bleomycin resistance protein/Dioxygenase superfamily protein [Amycolatopsis pretoriensis]